MYMVRLCSVRAANFTRNQKCWLDEAGYAQFTRVSAQMNF